MSKKSFTNNEVLTTLLDFAGYIVNTYGLHAKLPDGRTAIIKANPNALVRDWHNNLSTGSKAEHIAAGKDITQRIRP
jgi:hypothetical protein